MRKTSKFSFIAAFTAAVALALSGFAVADTMHSVDGSTALNGNDIQYNSGGTGNNYACSARGTAVAGAGVIRKKNDEGPTFANSAELSITGTSAQSGITVTPTTTTLPSDWRSLDNNTAHNFSFSTTVSTAVGTGTYSVTLKAEGPLAAGGTGFVQGAFAVVLVDCAAAGDATLPTNASVSINSAAAWTNNAAVSLALSATDNLGITRYRLAETQAGLATASDVAVSPAQTSFSSSPVSFTLTGGDGSSKAVWMRVFDAAGNSADASDTIGLDTVKPTITGNTGTYVPGQWTNQNVVVGFSCADNVGGSGIATNTVAGTTLTGSGANQQTSNTGVCTDTAGNSADAVTVSDIDIDKVLPVNTVTGPTNGATYPLGSTIPTAGCDTNDALSGTASTATASTVDNTTIGSKTVTCSGGTDNAGNTALDASVTYYVQAVSTAFSAPVDRAPTVNKTKTGRNVPLKWRLTDASGIGYSELTNAQAQVRLDGDTTCATMSSTDELEVYSSTTSGLQNLGNGYYQIDWKTPSTTGCRKVTVTIPGGGGPSAVFQFTK